MMDTTKSFSCDVDIVAITAPREVEKASCSAKVVGIGDGRMD
jgi:hypothetical protein